MAKRHFLSVLGTGNYSEAKYVCDEAGMATSYVQEAVLKLKMLKEGEYTSEDRITIFLTEKAAACNWYDRDYTPQELERMQGTEKPARKPGLGSVLRQSYDIKDEEAIRLIPLGATEDELWDIFNIIYEEIREGEELYVDITHSLRNIPIQMLSVITYAKVVKKIEVKGIYYGAFEAGTKNEEGMTEAPIFDLLTFLDILAWSQAANSFIKYGNSDEIKDLYDEQKERGSKELKKVVGDLADITQGLETSRGCYKEEKGGSAQGVSVLKSYRSYEEFYGIMQKKDKKAKNGQGQKKQIDPLNKLFDVINDKLNVFNVEDNLAFGYAAIEWAIENKKTQQGFTALDETIKTWLCRRYGLDEYLERHREGICKRICVLFSMELQAGKTPGEVFSAQGRAEVYRKWEENQKDQREENQGSKAKDNRKEGEAVPLTPEQEREAARNLSGELAPAFVKIGNEISSRRNSMNHFGYSNINQFGCKKLYTDLKAYYKQFRETAALMEGGTKEQNHGEQN